MSKWLKEALTVLIVTHVERVQSSVCGSCVKMMSKGLKEALTVLIVTHVTHVERVKSSVCDFYTTLYTE